MTQRPTTANSVTVERLEKAVHAMAYIVVRHGEQYGPLLDMLDDELTAMTRAPSARERAQRILNRSMREFAYAPGA